MSTLSDFLRSRRCTRAGCGHISDSHRLDDAMNVSPTDPTADFRCIIEGCTCPDMLLSSGDLMRANQLGQYR